MDSTNLILTQPVGPPTLLSGLTRLGDNASKLDTENVPDEKKQQIARDFESVLLTRMMDQMKETVGDWGFEKDGSASQVQGIFWLYLAQDIANNGGMGLWKDIHRFMTDGNQTNAAQKSSDVRL
jgi:Rod binding domain-containing protein